MAKFGFDSLVKGLAGKGFGKGGVQPGYRGIGQVGKKRVAKVGKSAPGPGGVQDGKVDNKPTDLSAREIKGKKISSLGFSTGTMKDMAGAHGKPNYSKAAKPRRMKSSKSAYPGD